MADLLDECASSSCVIETKNDDLTGMGVLHRIGKNFADVGSSHNELPGIPYNLLIKLEVHNTQLRFKVLIGRVYLSSPKLVRIVELSEVINDERREYFQINTRDEGIIYNCMRGSGTLDMGEESRGYNDLKVRLVDISLRGLMPCIRKEFKASNHFSIVVPAIGDSMLFIYKIHRRVGRPEGGYGYSCELVEMAIKQEDLLHRYILRQQGDQLRRIRQVRETRGGVVRKKRILWFRGDPGTSVWSGTGGW